MHNQISEMLTVLYAQRKMLTVLFARRKMLTDKKRDAPAEPYIIKLRTNITMTYLLPSGKKIQFQCISVHRQT